MLKDCEGKPLLCFLREGGGCKRHNSVCKGACRLAEKEKRLENQKWRGKRSEHGSSKAAAGAIKKAKRDQLKEHISPDSGFTVRLKRWVR